MDDRVHRELLLRPMAVALGTPTLSQCSIVIESFTGSSLSLAYAGLPGNQPRSYKNFVAVWQSSVVPWNVEPMARMTIPQDSETGSLVLDDLTIARTAYVVGYGVGEKVTTICATALLSAGGLRAAPTSVEIHLNSVGATSLSVHYRTLGGCRPHTFGHWVGLWKGYASPYYAPPPMAQAAVMSDASEDDVAINGIVLGVNTTYTLVYFTGPDPTEAAAILTFDTAAA